MSCFWAPFPSVIGQIRAPPVGFPALRALVRVFSGVQPVMLQEFVTVYKALSTLSAFLCNSPLWSINHGAGRYQTLSGRSGSSIAGGRRPVTMLLIAARLRNSLFCITAAPSVCFLLRWPCCIVCRHISCVLVRNFIRFFLDLKCFCISGSPLRQ